MHGLFSSTVTYKWAKLLYSAQFEFLISSLGFIISCCMYWLHGLAFASQVFSMMWDRYNNLMFYERALWVPQQLLHIV
jgi:hypothetical protein